jgi:Crp-like helix-turn-helix domain
MLGIRRTSVTLVAQELQERGIIKYSRGKIAILDRAALEAVACECYDAIRQLYRDRFGPGEEQAGGIARLRRSAVINAAK